MITIIDIDMVFRYMHGLALINTDKRNEFNKGAVKIKSRLFNESTFDTFATSLI